MAMDLSRVLKGYKPGRWVVLNGARTKVVASGRDPAEAVARAEKKQKKKKDKQLLLMVVMDSKTVCVY
jgi:hypothetical protein